MPALTMNDQFNMRRDAWDNRNDYRYVYLINPVLSSGSNYEPFTDSPYNVSDSGGATTITYETYQTKARIKIVQDTSLMRLLDPSISGLEVGDYLMYFRLSDREQVDKIYQNQHGYVVCDGITFRPNNVTLNGVGQVFDVTAHCKKYSPRYRATGL